MATVTQLKAAHETVSENGPVTVDLAGLTFIDSTGLRCILKYDAEARQDGFSIALIQGPPAVQRIFVLTGTTDRLPFIDP